MEHTKIYYFLNVNTHVRCVRDVIMMGSGNGHRPSQLLSCPKSRLFEGVYTVNTALSK